ncbi:MAG: site-specific DNA-methyltransferase [Acidaminococcaceae bacterium]|nr:site-specific DNA-methyltransferase [Acidaminococcaceae bacterium]
MAAIHELLKQVQDPALRARLTEEFAHATQNKKFGLVFEEHLPECTPLYGISIKRGSTVARKSAKISDTYTVIKLDDNIALCRNKAEGNMEEIKIDELVAVAEFGEPIFPYLEHIDSVENAPDSDLWHTLIEADNYHALQLLEYLYPQKVDCIYIDPPYNTGAKDWKYNNDYVDSSDAYRHSKWLSMMKKRLKLAKRLLNPNSGVLICTIDEHEVHHLRALLEQLFSDFYIQMTTYVINPKGVTQGRFSRVEEYALYCFAPQAKVAESKDNLLNPVEEERKPRWKGLLRSGTNSSRADRKNMFYPVLIDTKKNKVVGAGESLPLDINPIIGKKIDGYDVAWPIRTDGSWGNWGVGYETLRTLIDRGFVSLGKYDLKRKTWGISYISVPNQKLIDQGKIVITNRDALTNVVSIAYADSDNRAIKTVWHRTLHDAGAYGTDMVSSIVGQTRAFSFPKSLYAEKDAISAVLKKNKNALVVDFFAGSGTTLNAINLLNYEDDGNRRCILITNNECSDSEAKDLKESHYKPGDEEWEKHGICKSVTWPRAKFSIMGCRDDGNELEGEYFTNLIKEKEKSRNFTQIGFIKNATAMSTNDKKQLLSLFGKGILPQNLVKPDIKYIVSENEKHTISVLFDDSFVDDWLDALDGMEHITDFYIVTEKKAKFEEIKEKVIEVLGSLVIQEQVKLPMKNGFAANCEYFKLGFLDKDMVSLGRQFYEILPLLWMKSGAKGKRPDYSGEIEPQMLVLPENHFAVLVDETCYSAFAREVRKYDDIETVYFITNSESAYHEMAQNLGIADSYQLYRNYLDNFVIGARRNRT